MQDLKIVSTDILSNNWYTLKKISYEYRTKDGQLVNQTREAYDRGNGATIMLYNTDTQKIILTRQFRLPKFINGNEAGMLIEACAGLLDHDNPEDCIRRETEEETGYVLKDLRKIFDAYMSPGSVTEILYFFIAEYSSAMKVSDGGGLEHEQENIEVMEIPFEEAMLMIEDGRIRDAKTMLLLMYLRLKKIM